MRLLTIILLFGVSRGFAQDTVEIIMAKYIVPRSISTICLSDYSNPIDYSYLSRPLSYDLHSSILPIRNLYLKTGDSKGKYVNCELFSVLPASESYGILDSAGNLEYRASAGVALKFQNEHWYNRSQILTGWSNREMVDQDHPAFTPNHNYSYYWFNSVRTRTHYTPGESLDLSFGIDNHQIGNGYRSLIQSNQNAPAPFAMMRVNFWHLEYGLLYQFNHENIPSSTLWKFNALHYLSYNVTKRYNVTLVEQVLFQPKDGAFNRGFELEYLNPIVFFRPQEYSLGSTDNVLLGLTTSYSFNKHVIYGQVSLDEFVLDEIKKRSKWWANKYGAQIGAKGSVKGMKYVIEGNLVRPYTYSHINFGQNAGNMGLPTGHPLGSNFAELLAILTKEKYKSVENKSPNKFTYSAFTKFQLKGDDADSLSWGGNIYESYVLRPKEYGNTIGQGYTIRSIMFGGQFSYSNLKWPVEYYVQASANYNWGETKKGFTTVAMIGVRSTLFQSRRFF